MDEKKKKKNDNLVFHWFYLETTNGTNPISKNAKQYWCPFAINDSNRLEKAYRLLQRYRMEKNVKKKSKKLPQDNKPLHVSQSVHHLSTMDTTDEFYKLPEGVRWSEKKNDLIASVVGGLYDVWIDARERHPIYWKWSDLANHRPFPYESVCPKKMTESMKESERYMNVNNSKIQSMYNEDLMDIESASFNISHEQQSSKVEDKKNRQLSRENSKNVKDEEKNKNNIELLTASVVRRGSWYHRRHTDRLWSPYTEELAERFELLYQDCVNMNRWNNRMNLSNGDSIVLHSPNQMNHYITLFSRSAHRQNAEGCDMPSQFSADTFQGEFLAYRQMSRNINHIMENSTDMSKLIMNDCYEKPIDHLIFVVHGIGEGCDIRFRSLVECTEDMRLCTNELIKNFTFNNEESISGRIEYIPIHWHQQLHKNDDHHRNSKDKKESIDKRLARCTLPSIPFLRDYTNHTLIDILFYMNPIYSHQIILHVIKEMNRLYMLFKRRHSSFKGRIHIVGHSLGSIITFDVLTLQHLKHPNDIADISMFNVLKNVALFGMDIENNKNLILKFKPFSFIAMGSPIALFLSLRGLTNISQSQTLPTCKHIYNIFHPFDPVAYRIEPLIVKEFQHIPPIQLNDEHGGKKLHREFMKVTEEVKNRITNWRLKSLPNISQTNTNVNEDNKYFTWKLNEGNRIDYSLQESTIEYMNEYLFAVQSHGCYWQSADMLIFMIKQIYHHYENSSLTLIYDKSKNNQQTTISSYLPNLTSLDPFFGYFRSINNFWGYEKKTE
ncbi:hypothetical protein SNEBB_009058 [Seison nebaliae]|nr:hypothetical protein SNEBB_009058 [Seison nebaliae]